MTIEDTILILSLSPSPDATFHFGDHNEKMAIAKALVDKQIASQPGIEISERKICFKAKSETSNPQTKIPPTESLDLDSLTQTLERLWKTGDKSNLEIRHSFNPKDYEVIEISSKCKNCVVSLVVYRWLAKNQIHSGLSVDFQDNNNDPSGLTDSLELLEKIGNLGKQALAKIGLPISSFSVDITPSKISTTPETK